MRAGNGPCLLPLAPGVLSPGGDFPNTEHPPMPRKKPSPKKPLNPVEQEIERRLRRLRWIGEEVQRLEDTVRPKIKKLHAEAENHREVINVLRRPKEGKP